MQAATKSAAILTAMIAFYIGLAPLYAPAEAQVAKPDLSQISCNGLPPIAFTSRTADYDSTQKDMRVIGPAVIRCKFDGGDFDASQFVYSYSGSLMDGTPYPHTTEAPRYAGKYSVTVTVENAYYRDTASATLTIYPKSLSSSDFVLTVPSQVYSGDTLRPTVAQASNSRPKFLEGDVEYKYVNNVNAGTATIEMTGTSNYASNSNSGGLPDPVVRTFTISKKTISIDAAQCSLSYKHYDGTLNADTIVKRVWFSGLAGDDASHMKKDIDYTVVSAQFSSPDVVDTGTMATVAISLVPNGTYSKNYTLSGSSFRAKGYIIRAKPTMDLFVWDSTKDIPKNHTIGQTTGVPTPAVKPGVQGLGTRTVTYNLSATMPQTAGDYKVHLRIGVGKNYEAADLYLGTYTIYKALKPVITEEPSDTTRVRLGGTPIPLTVTAVSPNDGTLSYQWYNATNTPVLIKDATRSSYTPNTDIDTVLGDMYTLIYKYYVVVTNTKTVGATVQIDTVMSRTVTYTVFGPRAKSIVGRAEVTFFTNADGKTVVAAPSYPYTGQRIDPVADKKVRVTFLRDTTMINNKPQINRDTLKLDTTYTYTIQNNINAGTATITISGKELYTGSVQATFAIAKIYVNPDSHLVAQRSIPFSGGPQDMPVSFKSGLTGYGVISLTYGNLPAGFKHTNVGTYSVKINVSGGGNFYGLATRDFGTFDITPKAPEKSDLIYTIPENHVYTGFPFGKGIGTVTAKGGGAGTLTVYYDGSTAQPVNAGIYIVTVDVTGGTNYTPARYDDRVYIGEYEIHPQGWVSTQERDRVIPVPSGGSKEAVIAPITALSPKFTAGPNPVISGETVRFFRSGGAIASGTILVYDATGVLVKKIPVTGKALQGEVASWKADVPSGAYLAKATFRMKDGRVERASAMVAVRP